MATTEFKKVIIVSHKEDQERLLAKIHRLGLVEIIKPADFDNPYLKEGTSQAPQDLESILKELRYSMDFLKGFEVKKTFFESLAQKKPVLDFNNIGQILKEFNSSSFCKKVDEIRHSQKELDIESERLIQRRKEISSWLKLEVPLQEIGYTKYTLSHLGAILAEKLAKFKEEAMSGISDLVIEEIDEAQGLSFIYVVYLKTEEQKASAVFKRHGFNYVYLSGLTDRPREILEDVTNKLAEVKKDRVDLLNRAKALLAIRDRIFILHDYFSNLKKRQDVLKNFLYTAETFILTGWIRRKDIDKFKNWIKGSFSNVEIMTKAPSKKDKIPIELENKGFFKPFEFITNIYGLPAHGEVDPTPFLAPFFFLFFGFCLSDAG
jgi:V/A-type H+/Na+-transporting ATPase subunit I